ncbi:site-specific integrase [uncultured Algibacter sp.]|uniref:site-specific integrase n=1 Tax=uncultured Algibacter sp. TaxID=298659 RepID=UPI0026017380|nr:site-specific integrase [uncultured Algibacter sp.]
MNFKNIRVLFLLNRVKINKQNKSPIRCRVTYLGKRKVFSTGFFIVPKYWYSKEQKAKPPNSDNNYINLQLSLISQKINEAFLFLQVNNKPFDVEDIYLKYKGETTNEEKTLMEVFKTHNENMFKLIGKEYTKSTYYKFVEAKNHLSNFLSFKYKRNDILLSKITLKFIEDFDFYLKSELSHKQITINKSIQRLRKIIKLALAEGYLLKDPFILYKPKKYKVEVVYLDSDELQELESHDFSYNPRLERIRDCFVFCCYTGLAYAEMSALSHEHIIEGFDGSKWIKMYRQKTGSLLSVPLLPQANVILEKYQQEEGILPIITNQKFNSYLKEIAVILGFKKKLTHHIARKTFATTVLLYNDVPMEIVSELLGHSKMAITQKFYGKVVQKKVSEEIFRLKKKMKNS